MPIVLNTNASATEATFNLNQANDNLRRSIARLSSGSRITKPTDDAGGLAVAYKLRSSISRTEAALNNHQNALSYLQVQDGALEAMGDIVDRMAELRTLASDVSKSISDIENYSKEFVELQDQLNQMKREKFNGVELFATEEEWETMKGLNKSHLKINGEDYRTNQTAFGSKEQYEYFDHPQVENRTISEYDKYEFQLYTHPTGQEQDGNIKLNIVNLQFMLGIKNPNVFGIEQDIDSDGDGAMSPDEWTASGYDKNMDGLQDAAEVTASGLDTPDNAVSEEEFIAAVGSANLDGGVTDGVVSEAEILSAGILSAADLDLAAADGTLSPAEIAKAIAANPSLDTTGDGTISATEGADAPWYKEDSNGLPIGNTIGVNNTLNLAGLNSGIEANRVALDPSDGSVHSGNATANGGSGTDYASWLTPEGYVKDITKISVEEFTNIIEKIADVRAENGAEQQRVTQSVKLHENNLVNLQAAHGRIMDVDVAMESTRLARHSVTVQASAAMVAQANQMTAIALTLLSQ
jgi:flagellin